MMGNYHVRFGGGPMEKEHELPRQRPTLPTATADGLLYERLEQALAWADGYDGQGTCSVVRCAVTSPC